MRTLLSCGDLFVIISVNSRNVTDRRGLPCVPTKDVQTLDQPTNGKLIVVEGLDGSGKGTQTDLLCRRAEINGFRVRHISFPNYSDSSAALVRSYLSGEFGSKPDDVNAYAASTFYAVDRYAAYKKHWGADYHAGTHIIADRYTTSNAVYQMGKLPEDEWDNYLEWLTKSEYILMELPEPDLVIYLDMDPDVSRQLLSKRYEGDESRRDIHEADLEFQTRCRRSALYAAARLNWRVVRCDDGSLPRSVTDIGNEVWGIVQDCLEDGGEDDFCLAGDILMSYDHD